jgi:hypothetical protein
VNIMNKSLIPFAALALVLGLAFAAAAAGQDDDPETVYKFQDKDEIRSVLKFAEPGKPGTLVVDNVFGSIEVRGTGRADIEMTARRTIRAKSQDRIGRAKDEVKLDTKASGNGIDIYVDGPFRCQVQDCPGYRWRDWGYEVQYDFILEVPRRIGLTLKTVNRGAILVQGVEGDFDVRNVNGKIVLDAVAGAGRAHTVNGGVRVGFVRNPDSACSFKTVNGDVEASFRAGLSADLRLQTMHGEAYSDFASTKLPDEPVTRETAEGRTIFRRSGATGARVGKGGPVIRCETLNGDILIKRND